MNPTRAMCFEAQSCFVGLSVFSGIRKSPVLSSLERLVAVTGNVEPKAFDLIEAWADFTSVFAANNHGRSFYMFLTDLVLEDENTFTLLAERGAFQEDSMLHSLVKNDLRRLSIIGDFDIPMMALYITDELWKAELEDSARLIDDGVRAIGELKEKNFDLDTNSLPYSLLHTCNVKSFAESVRKNGAGLLSKHHFFFWKRGTGLVPARNPDNVNTDNFSGYDSQRRIVLENTVRFIKRAGGANNLLLYGDRGTGKSATVKAVCSSLKDQGLRLVEVYKQDLDEIPTILAELGSRGLSFVLFIDDLSFETQSSDFTMLKGFLEGGVETRPPNVVVYATSNRRHLVRELSGDRTPSESETRAFDTMQEQLSLADRFGITLVFTSPTQDEFLRIAEFLAERRGLFSARHKDGGNAPLDRKEFRENARKWERWFNGRSPRTANQFVEWSVGGSTYPWE